MWWHIFRACAHILKPGTESVTTEGSAISATFLNAVFSTVDFNEAAGIKTQSYLSVNDDLKSHNCNLDFKSSPSKTKSLFLCVT